jgi:rare lipoprotein A
MVDMSGVRHHFKLVDVRYPIFQVIKDRKPTPMQPDDLFAGDITIGVLDRPAPANLKAYDIASKVIEKEWIAVQNQEFLISMGRLITREGAAIASLKNSDIIMIAGDSGLPWFNKENEIVSHNTLGGDGHGPLYCHLFIDKQLKNELKSVESSLSQEAEVSSQEVGVASFYSTKTGSETASGETLKDSAFTAAHKTLDFGTKVKVTNLNNQKSVVVKINDRGPFVKGRIIDVSKAAATSLGFYNKGLAKVKVQVLKN